AEVEAGAVDAEPRRDSLAVQIDELSRPGGAVAQDLDLAGRRAAQRGLPAHRELQILADRQLVGQRRNTRERVARRALRRDGDARDLDRRVAPGPQDELPVDLRPGARLAEVDGEISREVVVAA